MNEKKIRFEDTMMDERLISEYKDEIKQEIASELGIEYQHDALKEIEIDSEQLEKTNRKINK